MVEEDENVTEKPQDSGEEEELPPHWRKIHGAIWLIGLAILFWQDWIFPGILVLIGISTLAQGLIMAYYRRNRAQEEVTTLRSKSLPDYCPNCGGPLDADEVTWSSQFRARCPFCGSSITVQQPARSNRDQESAPERHPTP